MEICQLIIARKDLGMSPGKLAAQVSHASMAFLTTPITRTAKKIGYKYRLELNIEKELFENWMDGSYTKVICEAKNYNQLLKATDIAKELGLVENFDYFLIKDLCLTELTPEEYDENGVGHTLTCIGFAPMPKELCQKISKKYQLYK